MEMMLHLLVMTHCPGTRGQGGGGEAPGEKQGANYSFLKPAVSLDPNAPFPVMPLGEFASAPASP